MSDIETLLHLSNKNIIPLNTMFLETFGLRKRMYNHLNPNNFDEFDIIFNPIYDIWNEWNNNKIFYQGKYIKVMNELTNFLKNIIFSNTEQFLQKFNKYDFKCINLKII
jgi:hypothetical protein